LARILVVAAFLRLAAGLAGGQAPPPSSAPQASAHQVPGGDWQDAPGYLRLFAPTGARAAAYRVYVSTLDMEMLLRRLATDPSLLHPPGAWLPASLLPSDAFGQTGGYDRSKLARLYGSTRAMVARGPRGRDGQPTEAWTLVSPYPSRDMDHLEPGTMLIVLDLGQLATP
jgi:hypothetical protein